MKKKNGYMAVLSVDKNGTNLHLPRAEKKKIVFVNLQDKCLQTNFSCMYGKEGVNTNRYRKNWHAIV